MTRLMWIKRKSVAAVVICTILAVASIAFWQMNQGAQAAMVYPHPGLVGWWRFDEGSGTVAKDSSGNGYSGAIYGASWVTGKYDYALKFNGNGIGNYGSVDVGNVLNMGANSFSISQWVNFDDVTSRAFCVIKGHLDGYNQAGNAGYGIAVNGGILSFEVKDSATRLSVGSSVAVDNWYYVVGVCNRTANTIKLYLNGSLVGSTNIAGLGSLSNSYNLRLGSYTWVDSSYGNLNGVLDEVGIYNRALSASEIQGNSQNGPDFSSNILAKVPQGTTQVITTLSWQGPGNINVTLQSPTQNYNESMMPSYQKTTYSTSGGISSMLNIKRLSVTVNALPSNQDWYIMLEYDNTVDAYQISVETQK